MVYMPKNGNADDPGPPPNAGSAARPSKHRGRFVRLPLPEQINLTGDITGIAGFKTSAVLVLKSDIVRIIELDNKNRMCQVLINGLSSPLLIALSVDELLERIDV